MEAEQRRLGEELDLSYQKLSEFVCKHGPELLTVGMPPLRANQALLACLEKLLHERDVHQRHWNSAMDYFEDTMENHHLQLLGKRLRAEHAVDLARQGQEDDGAHDA